MMHRIAAFSQHTPGVEVHVFDGFDGSEMAFWKVERDARNRGAPPRFPWFLFAAVPTCRCSTAKVCVEAGAPDPRGTATPKPSADDDALTQCDTPEVGGPAQY